MLMKHVAFVLAAPLALVSAATLNAADAPVSNGACRSPAPAAASPAHLFFDDFAYSRHEQLERRGWIVRSVAGWPGVPGATWDKGGVSFADPPSVHGILRLTVSTDGTPQNTRQAQICHERKYGDGTYAARVRFTDEPISGADGDEVIQTFYMISPLREPMALEYSEIDFEYLPNGGWGRVGPTLFATTWETFRPDPDWKADNVHESKARTYAGWRTLVVQVADGEVRYFVDGEPFATHAGAVYPESLMSINFNLWFTRNGLARGREVRKYRQEVDWVFHAAKTVLTPGEVDATVTAFRKTAVRFRDTVPDAVPPLASPCNL